MRLRWDRRQNTGWLLVFCLFVVLPLLSSCGWRTEPPLKKAPAPKGQVRVALLLPLSAEGEVGTVAHAMQQAARMALDDASLTGQSPVSLVPHDTAGSPRGAERAAKKAIAGNVDLIVGPLLSGSVATVGPLAQEARIPVIAFSTDTNTAGNGVFLLSFPPKDSVQRILSHAIAKERRSLAAFMPTSTRASLEEASLFQVAASRRISVAGIVHYPPAYPVGDADANRLVHLVEASGADVLLSPGPPSNLISPAFFSALHRINLNRSEEKRILILGSGEWDDPRAPLHPALAGSRYAAPDPAAWRKWAARYRERFGSMPARTASLAYDALSLAVALVQGQNEGKRFSRASLTNKRGFRGVDGIFRFEKNGHIRRGLAIMEVGIDGVSRVIVQPANTLTGREPPVLILPFRARFPREVPPSGRRGGSAPPSWLLGGHSLPERATLVP